MSLRLKVPLFLAATLVVVAGCKDVDQDTPAERLVIATFASPVIPTPNDLALQAVPTLPAGAQRDLLQAFVDQGGFPSDQEVPVTVPIRALLRDATTGAYAPTTPPTIDPATITASTAGVLKIDGGTVTVVETEAGPAAPGQIVIRKKADGTGSRRWAPGRYVFAVRGGANGVKTADGLAVGADSAIALTVPNKDLTNPNNQPPGGIPPAALPQLEAVRAVLWNPVDWATRDAGGLNVWATCTPPAAGCQTGQVSPAFAAVDTIFPHTEVASVGTFEIAPAAGPLVLIDAGSGQAPLPIDLLRTGPNGTIANNPAFGPAAAGLATLDGFSTTAMILAQTSVPVDAATVNGANVHLFQIEGDTATLVRELKSELGAGGAGNPAAAGYVAEPTPIVIPQGQPLAPGVACPAAGGCSPAIGLQAAALAPVPGGPTFTLPPLREGTIYAVLVTNRVKDIQGRALVKPTVAKILLDSTQPVVADGRSTLAGVSDATAAALAAMRTELGKALAALPTGTTREDVVTAYTFRTQSVAGVSTRLAAAPYSIEAGAGQAIFTPSAAAPVTAPQGVPTANVNAFYDVTFKSVDAIDKTTGALRPTLQADLANPLPLLADLHALVAVPNADRVPVCPTGVGFPDGARCAKVVVVGHGLNGSKETLFAVASGLASAGFIAAAIDFPLHGGRNWCTANADCVNPANGQDGTCTPFAGGAGQGDAIPPGVCTGGSVSKPGASRHFVSSNFFRMRDAFRQNVLDQSALVLALSRPPNLPQPPGNPVTAALPAGVVVDPTAVRYEGISLGAIAGSSVVATNPRIDRAVLAAGGGTFVDIATTSPTFRQQLGPLFTTLLASALPRNPDGSPQPFTFGMVTPGDPAFDGNVAQAFLRIVNVAKWVLDPGEAVNYAQHVRLAPLPDLLANPDGSVAQAPKDVLGLVSTNDTVVPNPTNALLFNLMDADQTVYRRAGDDPSVAHAIIGTSPVVQGHAAAYLLDLTTPDPVVELP